MSRASRLTALLLALALIGAVTGCNKASEEPELQPTITPPAIGSAGVLKVGVDLDYPPFAGTDGGAKAGIDIDVAAAIAERLGLKVELVDIKPDKMASALADGKVDIVLGGVSITDIVVADAATAGSYVVDGPGIFSLVTEGSTPATLTASALPGKRVGVQKSSASFWRLESDFGADFATSFDTLEKAFEALEAGELDLVVADAAVGVYMARDFDGVRFVGQYGAAQPLGVAIRKDAGELEAQVRAALDELAADGTLDAIRGKWLGDLPKLEVPQASS